VSVGLEQRTWAATYAVPDQAGAYGVDLIAQDVETDDGGRVLTRDEAGWSWHPARHLETWDTGAADRHLYALGWVRVSPWEAHDDLAGMRGWTCDVRPDGGRPLGRGGERGTVLVGGVRVPAARYGRSVYLTTPDGACPACSAPACRGRNAHPSLDSTWQATS